MAPVKVELVASRDYRAGSIRLGLTIRNSSGQIISEGGIKKGDRDWTVTREQTPDGIVRYKHETATWDVPSPESAAAITLKHAGAGGQKPEALKTLIVSLAVSNVGDAAALRAFPTDGYLASKPRTFFSVTLLPAATPVALQALRQEELKKLQGADTDPNSGVDPAAARGGDDMVYSYQEYDDLSGDLDKDFAGNARPTLGGSQHPYPRRLRTNRKMIKGTDGQLYESPPSAGSVAWVPMDEAFGAEKAADFLGYNVAGFLPLLKQILFDKRAKYSSMAEVLGLYDNDDGELEPTRPRTKKSGVSSLVWGNVRWVGMLSTALAAAIKSGYTIVGSVSSAFKYYNAVDDIVEYPAPMAIAGVGKLVQTLKDEKPPTLLQVPPGGGAARVECWRADEEFGRQYLAGLNPMVLRAMTGGIPPASGITKEMLMPFLEAQSAPPPPPPQQQGQEQQEGQKAQQPAAAADAFDVLTDKAAPRLFYVDYHTVIAGFLKRINGTYADPARQDRRVQHAGFCILYRRTDGKTVPIAISLTDDAGKPPAVYTPRSPAPVWSLAKSIFASIDSGYHQLISHWLRTHCCQEPYLIATRRMLSAMHPVYKLIMPHFRYTLPINARARSSLINVGSVIELAFSPGRYSMELSSAVYGAAWRFVDEALDADLSNRGFLDESGKQLLVPDYPYAEDGLLIWKAIETYFTKYIELYYTSDAEVLADGELQAWWEDIKTKGHADKADDPTWPVLNSRASLVRILATMAWMGSGHHAAVNFGQYDYGAFMPARPTMITKPMPRPGSPEHAELAAAAAGDAADSLLLTWMTPPTAAMNVITVVKGLSTHALDERYLSDVEQPYITDPAARKLHSDFVVAVMAAEDEIIKRNVNAGNVARSLQAKGLPYRYLMPSSTPGITGRGVPYSISI